MHRQIDEHDPSYEWTEHDQEVLFDLVRVADMLTAGQLRGLEDRYPVTFKRLKAALGR
jgi:hypothetical protein